MLIVLPSTPTTLLASQFLASQGIAHQVISVPPELGYKTSSDVAIYSNDTAHGDLAMLLTKQRFVVMRVFRDYVDSSNKCGRGGG